MYDDEEMDDEGLHNVGEMALNNFNDANIPVDIWIEELNEETDDGESDEKYKAGYRFRLHCGNYMPRKGRVEECAADVYTKDKESLQNAVKKYILPLYQTALNIVTKMANECKGSLYYWEEEK